MALNIVQSSDGRRQRSERSQTAIIEAALELMDEGILVPTAQQIADRAGVGIRSFFRHFADMDALFMAADEMLMESYEALFQVDDRAGDLAERVARAVDLYGNAFDKLQPIILCTQALLWRFPKLRENYAWHQKRLRKELELWVPEVAALSKDQREAVHAVASFEMWHRLCEHQGQSPKVSAETVAGLILALVNAD
ncbi:MAG: TetR/AcrR family transcriptional regulator [Pseudomonadota bacterium]|nr:TetR/AcrR family transcriptional regulator [Luminiphilus sp.]MDA9711182.1 TetR/AcrR family transcriptional regulator [Luminiphilus sp.]MED5315154.1 TetR/AcrR family transcriptional regulator [Pseudomonadota bacterium]